MTAQEFLAVLQTTGLPAVYSHFREPKKPPFIVYIGGGQDQFRADNTPYWKNNLFTVQYYFTEKDPATETVIEEAFDNAGIIYDKSDDTWIPGEGVFVIYYYCQ